MEMYVKRGTIYKPIIPLSCNVIFLYVDWVKDTRTQIIQIWGTVFVKGRVGRQHKIFCQYRASEITCTFQNTILLYERSLERIVNPDPIVKTVTHINSPRISVQI